MKEKTYSELSEALRALAETDAAQEAAPQVEAALLQAFRQTTQPTTLPTAAPQPARVLAFPVRRPAMRWRVGLAAAALLLLSFGWFGWRAWQPAPAPPNYATNDAKQSPAPQPETNVAQTKDQKVEQVSNLLRSNVNPERKGQVGNHNSKALPRPGGSPSNIRVLPVEEEIATEFFPLVEQDALPARGQLRRVQVPRATLINFGLPVNAERIEFPINADLLVGEDGQARAIRFVQERFPDEAVINVYGSTSRKAIPTSFRNPR